MARTILEPLTALDENGDWQPYLAESVTPNDGATEWTIVVRSGIEFCIRLDGGARLRATPGR